MTAVVADTHTIIWYLRDHTRLSPAAMNALDNWDWVRCRWLSISASLGWARDCLGDSLGDGFNQCYGWEYS